MERSASGWINGFIGVMIFAGTLPATRMAVLQLDAGFVTAARAIIAAVLAVALLLTLRQPLPHRRDLPPLLAVSLGVVVGFPLLTALALRHASSAHAIVFVGLLPLLTAVFGVLRGGDRPRPAFWVCSVLGSACVVGYATRHGIQASWRADLLMLAAIAACGMGYAEGARLSRHLGGWQVISWALVIALPVMLPLMLVSWPPSVAHITAPAWWALGYVGVFSMMVGFVFWYRGLALGGIAAVSQLQLLQPFMGLALAALLLHEAVDASMLLVTLAAVLCVAGAKRFSR
ncbi:DMT family transporter [Stenotrophomonas sp. 24(2023)]|uniref:DMT family transporter n=1 Tax=Stenotrophomonas sp. 24(2023) TaxID=3068324 RepID=UPI0027DED9D1|nr:DMT family transporter [Stenotrophomonas sp. 24(2023)]WMJ68087.1 DMT family transporter [Stenotrophomonas sp. 24(2023)]